VNGAIEKRPFSARTFMTLPRINVNDDIRHNYWNQRAQIEQYPRLDAQRPGDLGHCYCASRAEGICQCGLLPMNIQVAFSVDSIYYPGVFEGIARHVQRTPMHRAWAAFADFKHAISNGHTSYSLYDGEGDVVLSQRNGQYISRMYTRGNESCYEHGIVNTANGSWQVTNPVGGGFIHFTVKLAMNYGKHRYILTRIVHVASEVPGVTTFDTFLKPADEQAPVIMEKAAQWFGSLWQSFKDAISRAGATVTFATDERKFEYTIDGEKYIVEVEDLLSFYKLCVGKASLSTADALGQYGRALRSKIVSGSLDIRNIKNYRAAAKIAWDMTAKDTIAVHQFFEENSNIREANERMKGVWVQPSTITNVFKPISLLLFILLGISVYANFFTPPTIQVERVLVNPKTIGEYEELGLEPSWDNTVKCVKPKYTPYPHRFPSGVVSKRFEWSLDDCLIDNCYVGRERQSCLPEHMPQDDSAPIWQDGELKDGPVFFVQAGVGNLNPLAWIWEFLYVWVVAKFLNKLMRRPAMQTLGGTCVTDTTRLDKNLINAVSRFTAEDPLYDPTLYNSGAEYAATVGCDCKRTTYAWQAAPLLLGSRRVVPTIKHNCTLTQVAASIRACSNQVFPDESCLKQYLMPELTGIFKEISDGVIADGLVVSEQDWLAKYPIEYRNKMELAKIALRSKGWEYTRVKYEAFPKIEKQFTEVEEAYKDEPINDVKERQICGPSDEKKVIGNAFVNAMEKLCTKHVRGYCGNSSWDQITTKLADWECEYRDPIWFAGDGSGFDMTQSYAIIQMWNDVLEKFLKKHEGQIIYPQYIDHEDIMVVFRESEILSVSVMRGLVNYKTKGTRASGDGWTSWANSLLQLAYWRCVRTHSRTKLDVLCKGDDVIGVTDIKEKANIEKSVKALFTQDKAPKVHGLGQILKFIKWGTLDELDFLSAYFVQDGHGGYNLTRIPARILQLTPWVTSIPTEIVRKPVALEAYTRNICYANGLCGLSWAHGLPVWEEYYRMLIRLSRVQRDEISDLCDIETALTELNVKIDQFNARLVNKWRDHRDRQAYMDWLYDKYGWSRYDVDSLEATFRAVSHIYDEVRIPALDDLFGY